MSSPEFEEMTTTFAMEAAKQSRLPIPRGVSRKKVQEAFLNAFEMIGGVPRLALWAHQNPTEFYRLYSRLLPPAVQEHSGTIKIVHSIRRTALDGEVIQDDATVVAEIPHEEESRE